MTDASKTRQRLWHSLEMGVIRRNLVIYTLITGLAVLMASCQGSAYDDGSLQVILMS